MFIPGNEKDQKGKKNLRKTIENNEKQWKATENKKKLRQTTKNNEKQRKTMKNNE